MRDGEGRFPQPENEAARRAAVAAYRVMDTMPEPQFDEIGEIAAEICGCPVAYVSFIDEDRLFFKARYGLPEDMTGCPREIAFCSVTICGADLVHVPNLAEDERFRDFHFVVNEPCFRFYAAMPLISPEGHALGTLCVMDFEPKTLSFDQQDALRRLALQLVATLEYRRRLIENGETMRRLEAAQAEVAEEKARSEALLHRVLPERIARELRETGRVEPRFYQSTTVLMADVKGFTALTERTEPAALIGMLDAYFARFDELMDRRGLEKIKTIGDAYLAVAGAPEAGRRHALRACVAALDMRAAAEEMGRERARLRLPVLEMRIGLHSGPLIAGVVGRQRFTFDVWGDAANLAARMEAASEPGRINISDAVHEQVKPYFETTPRGRLEVKNRAPMEMFFLDGLRPEYAEAGAPDRPNARLLALLEGGRGGVNFDRPGAGAQPLN